LQVHVAITARCYAERGYEIACSRIRKLISAKIAH